MMKVGSNLGILLERVSNNRAHPKVGRPEERAADVGLNAGILIEQVSSERAHLRVGRSREETGESVGTREHYYSGRAMTKLSPKTTGKGRHSASRLEAIDAARAGEQLHSSAHHPEAKGVSSIVWDPCTLVKRVSSRGA